LWIPLLRYNFEPNMSSSSPRNIAGLFSYDAAVRTSSAAAIYNQGLALAGPVASSWVANRDFSRLLGERPVVTVGLAVCPETFARIREAHGNPRLADIPADQDAKEFELHFPTAISLDILTIADPTGEGAIARFLKRFGEGIQQVEYRCSDVDRATAILREEFGVAPVYPETRPGADNTRINFFLVPTNAGGKVLIELYEIPGATRPVGSVTS
jgi:hypothetical protein